MYGGTEIIVSHLTEGLVKRGHEVTLFATKDSITSAKLVPIRDKPVRMDPDNIWPLDYYVAQTMAIEIAEEYIKSDPNIDIIHNNMDFYALHFSKHVKAPFVSTFHGRIDFKTMLEFYPRHNDTHFISISNNQQSMMPNLNWAGTVYNGIDLQKYPYNHEPKGDYLLFLSRLSDEKGPLEAIEVAKRTRKKLIMASKVDPSDSFFFAKYLVPLIDNEQIIYIGEVSHEEKIKLYENALAYLLPLKWPEPFGLTMVEAMACGTPVLAFMSGSAPEIIQHGVSGYLSTNVAQMTQDVLRADRLRREDCRMRAEFFSKENMVENYVKMYEKILKEIR
ncbi:MAG: Glycosyltransferase [candidate division CPR2 bacterium GW2011_GWD2_39_7]|nr:MAG: Glycosyltransferase [candidate division CPR2 bacterium GW2011_GWD2_39_7]